MKIVVIMAGLGERFLKAGYGFVKPLIKVDGKPMVEHVVNLFSKEDEFIFICNKDQLRKTPIREELNRINKEGKIVEIEFKKKGPVYAVLKARRYIKETEPFIVVYCDFFMHWDYKDFKRVMEEKEPSGCVPCYTGFHPHLLRNQLYAGVRTTNDNWMLEIKEKHRFTENPIDTWHSPGIYYFGKGKYLDYFSKLMKSKETINGEQYISMVYPLMLKDNLPIYVYPIKYFMQWGTPEDLQEYEWWSNLFKMIKNNIIAEETIKFKTKEGRQIFNYWKKCLSLMDFHPYEY